MTTVNMVVRRELSMTAGWQLAEWTHPSLCTEHIRSLFLIERVYML